MLVMKLKKLNGGMLGHKELTLFIQIGEIFQT